MAKFIEDVHNLVNFYAGKNVATKQPPERIDLVIYKVITKLYTEYIRVYPKNKEVEAFLLPFMRTAPLTVTGGIAALPVDYRQYRMVETLAGKEVDVVSDHFWDRRKNSSVSPPTMANPIARLDMREVSAVQTKVLEVFPAQNVVLRYLKEPTRPKYAYTKQGDRYVYDEVNSVDIEFPPALFEQIQNEVLSGMGINIRDRDLIVYTQNAKAVEPRK